MDNKTAIYQTIKDAREYLKLFKLGLNVRTSEDDIFEMKRTYGDFIGMYEHESVFSGTVIIYLNVDDLEEASEVDDFYYDDVSLVMSQTSFFFVERNTGFVTKPTYRFNASTVKQCKILKSFCFNTCTVQSFFVPLSQKSET